MNRVRKTALEYNMHKTLETVADADNEALIRRFERGDVPPESFHHADHVRLAFAYLLTYPHVQALERFSEALKTFASKQGKAERYHETITWAYFFLIRQRMAQMPDSSDWNSFAERNPDLLEWQDGILKRYYAAETLRFDLARKVFVLPDSAVSI